MTVSVAAKKSGMSGTRSMSEGSEMCEAQA